MPRQQFYRRLSVSVGFVIGLLSLAGSVQAADGPLARIRATVEEASAILNNPTYQGAENFQERIVKLETVLLPRVDSWEFAQRCLGAHWRELNETQRKEFMGLFQSLLEKTYGNMLDRYPDGVRFEFDRERVDGAYAEVNTRVFNPVRQEPFTVDYRLHNKDGQWLIYDVIAENVSMVRNYRTQFNRIISKSSFDGLVDVLKRKLQELEKPPATS